VTAAEQGSDMSTTFTDIRADGWVRRAPASWRPYLLLARLDRPIGIWLLFLPGAWGILLGRAPWPRTIVLLLLFAIGSVVMRAAGCVVNDLWDRDLDRRVARTAARPLAAGLISPFQALVFLAALLSAGLQLPVLCWALGVLSLVLVGLYPLAKRITWWPQLVMGFTFGFGAPMGYAAAAARLDATWAALYAAAIFWDLGFDTIYGFQDMEDDALVGIRSTSRLFARTPRLFVGAAYTLCLAALAVAGLLGHLAWPYFALMAVAGRLFLSQVLSLDTANPAQCLTLFRRNREAGIAIALAILAGRFG